MAPPATGGCSRGGGRLGCGLGGGRLGGGRGGSRFGSGGGFRESKPATGGRGGGLLGGLLGGDRGGGFFGGGLRRSVPAPPSMPPLMPVPVVMLMFSWGPVSLQLTEGSGRQGRSGRGEQSF